MNVLISTRNGYKQLNDIANVDLWIEFLLIIGSSSSVKKMDFVEIIHVV